MQKSKVMILLFLVVWCFLPRAYCYHLETLYGQDTITEPVLIALLQCPTLQRLRYIQQYGVIYYIKSIPSYSRYEHSIGVFFLVRKFGGSLLEQIAALLHDVSHTVFSHVGDHLFKHADGAYSYQDTIHNDFLAATEIAAILSQHGITLESINHKNNHFFILEQDLPTICADRLEYVLYGGLLEGYITKNEIHAIIDSLRFCENKWVFTQKQYALLFARLSLLLTHHLFGSPFNNVVYYWTAKALRRALVIEKISLQEIHHGTDEKVWQKLMSSKDSIIQQYLHMLHHYDRYYTVVSAADSYDKHFVSKFRGIDPWVFKQDGSVVRLSSLDASFEQQFNSVKEFFLAGQYIQFHPFRSLCQARKFFA